MNQQKACEIARKWSEDKAKRLRNDAAHARKAYKAGPMQIACSAYAIERQAKRFKFLEDGNQPENFNVTHW